MLGTTFKGAQYRLHETNTRRKDVLFQAWAHYLSFYKKRTLSTECYELYHHHFANSSRSRPR